MLILADENVPAPVVERLRGVCFDVEFVVETAPGLMDPPVLDRAREGARLLITADRDFGTLIFGEQRSVPVGVLYLRLGAMSLSALIDAVLDVIEDPTRELIGYFTTVQPGRVRQRPLPS